MTFSYCADLLAALPDETSYFSPWKIGAMVVLVALWALFAAWVDKDTVAVNTYQAIWNIVAMFGGLILIVVLLFVPIFWIGLAAFVVGLLSIFIAYVVHRNGLVREEDKVFTAAHIKRVMSEGLSGKKKPQKEVRVRVRVRGADGSYRSTPDDEEGREQYRLTQELLFDLLWNRAQRVELSPGREATAVNYEIDGVVSQRQPMVRAEADGVLAYLKDAAGLDLEEKRKPQKGKISVKMGEDPVEIEVRTDGSTAGEKLTLRVIGEETRYKIKDLGFTDWQMDRLQDVMQTSKGVVLVGGARESGQTTTVYSITRSHDAFLQNIQTLEYNIETPVDNVTQLQHRPTEGRTFAEELQRLFRTDPDIVILPELREQAAALIAAEAATKKQLVYIGMSSPDAFSVLRKWIDLVGDAGKAAGCLLAVTNQRLVRRLCPGCKQPYKPDPAQLRKLNMPADTVLYRQPEPEFDKRGEPIICQNCQGSGYVGRVGVFELMVVDDALRDVIRRAKSMNDIQAAVTNQRGMGLQKQAIQKVLEGVTSIQEITRVLRGGKAAPAPTPTAAPSR